MSMPSGRDHGSGERRRYRAYVRGQGGYGAVGRSSPAPVDDFEIADGEDIPEELLLSADRRKSSWRLIEQLREQRQLQMQLEDFDQYVV